MQAQKQACIRCSQRVVNTTIWLAWRGFVEQFGKISLSFFKICPPLAAKSPPSPSSLPTLQTFLVCSHDSSFPLASQILVFPKVLPLALFSLNTISGQCVYLPGWDVHLCMDNTQVCTSNSNLCLIYTSIKFELAQGGYCTEINSRQTFAAGKNCSIVSGEHKGLWDCP